MSEDDTGFFSFVADVMVSESRKLTHDSGRVQHECSQHSISTSTACSVADKDTICRRLQSMHLIKPSYFRYK